MTTLPHDRARTIVLSRVVAHARNLAGLNPLHISTIAGVQKSLEQTNEHSLWISFEATLTNALLRSVRWPSKPLGSALFLHRATLSSMTVLRTCFSRFAFHTDGGFLPDIELCEVLKAAQRNDLLIGGFVDDASRTVTLWRGNLDSITVPFSAFPPSGDGTAPDFSRFAVRDCGQTVEFGDYEASTDSILYENDANYRRSIKKKRVNNDSTLGGSIRRLRLQRQLRRTDFSPLTEKTIGRIERGESEHLQPRTLKVLSDKLGVASTELGTF